MITGSVEVGMDGPEKTVDADHAPEPVIGLERNRRSECSGIRIRAGIDFMSLQLAPYTPEQWTRGS